MIPPLWQFVLLSLGAFRLTRLLGWDTVTEPWRERLVGRVHVPSGQEDDSGYDEVAHPMLAEFLHCAFCLGFWVSLAFYGAWLGNARATLYVATPLALSAVVGLLAKQLDP